MSVNTQLIKGHIEINGRAASEIYDRIQLVPRFEQPMGNVVIRTESFTPGASVEFPFRKSRLPCLEFVYTLSCDTVLSMRNGPGDWRKTHISGGVRSLGYNRELSGIMAVNSAAPIRILSLYITPQKLARLLGPGSGHLVRAMIDKADPGSPGGLNLTPICPATTSILHQVFTRDSASPADSLFLKGKILELLAREVDFFCSRPREQILLQPDDVRGLQRARAAMMERMSSPPTIAELAREVGLNEKKIKQGFKTLYGTTVYGFLRDFRMDQAKLMFDRDHKSVTDVAGAVGYANVSHFGVVFRRHHGVRPGDYLRSAKADGLTRRLHL